MHIALDLVPGHSGSMGWRMPDGSVQVTDDQPAHATGYLAACSCGWAGAGDHSLTEIGRMSATSEWFGHMKPLWAAAPPGWLLNRSDTLRDNIAELTDRWPLQALALLAEVDRWQRPLTDRAVAAARAAGHPWADIGSTLGITKQSAHERFAPRLP